MTTPRQTQMGRNHMQTCSLMSAMMLERVLTQPGKSDTQVSDSVMI